MIDYDCKQIEANLKLAGFEDISSSNINIKDEKTGHMIQTISIEATKPESKRNADITLEIKKTSYVEKPRGRQIREEPVKKEKYNFTIKGQSHLLSTLHSPTAYFICFFLII